MTRYVSDIIDELIEGAAIRGLVREQCQSVLSGLATDALSALRAPLHHYAGKCMGFPAIWIAQAALGWSLETTAAMLRAHPGPLYISLSTSIADDFLDRDEDVGSAELMMLYLLVFGALREPHWLHGEEERHWRQKIYPLVSMFALQSTRPTPGSPAYERAAADSSARIGNFFEVIVFAMTQSLASGAVRAPLVTLAGKFGRWCSHLDDIMDIENDILAGNTPTFPLYLLTQRSENLAAAIHSRNFAECRGVIESPDFIRRLAESQQIRTDELIDLARRAGFLDLARQFTRISAQLPAVVQRLRSERSMHRARVAT